MNDASCIRLAGRWLLLGDNFDGSAGKYTRTLMELLAVTVQADPESNGEEKPLANGSPRRRGAHHVASPPHPPSAR